LLCSIGEGGRGGERILRFLFSAQANLGRVRQVIVETLIPLRRKKVLGTV